LLRAKIDVGGRARGAVVAIWASLVLSHPASAAAPFAIGASAGPEASARVEATVTRTRGTLRVTLPAAVVPALEPGDEVAMRFPDYIRPPARVNYHVDVAFITEVAPQRWLYEKSGPWDALFANRKGRRPPPQPPDPELRFTYGPDFRHGIPIFFIVPEDNKTRGMDGVRDYVDAHPTDFVTMSDSANESVDRYTWFSDFLGSLSQGAIDPYSGRQRIEDVAAGLGASPASIDACYVPGASSADVGNCIQSTMASLQYGTNIAAPTQAQLFGGLAGAIAPLQIAAYLEPVLDIWRILVRTGHQEYEYLPTTLEIATRDVERGASLLMGLKVPTIRPPGALSSALFFTIGDPQAAAAPPVVIDDADRSGVCARDERTSVPLHLDHTSKYVNATALVVTPDSKPAFTIPLASDVAGAPVVDRTAIDDGTDAGYSVRLVGRFGFDPIGQPERPSARMAIPHQASWAVEAAPHRSAIAGRTLDAIATSVAAPCLSSAELQIGSAAPVALGITHLDERRVALHATLAGVPEGTAHVRFYQDDPMHRTQIETDTTLAIAAPPAHVATGSVPTAHIGDSFVSLGGAGLDAIAALSLGTNRYAKDPSSTADAACFVGPALGAPLQAGAAVPAQLIASDGSPGEAFDIAIAAARPAFATPAAAPAGTLHLSSDPTQVTLSTVSGDLPARREVRVRRAGSNVSPCDVRDDPNAAVIASDDTHEDTPSRLNVVLRAAQALGDRAYGTLQLQVVDTQTKTASDWIDVPGTFVRAPLGVRIECAAAPSPACTLIGSGLGAIAGIEDAAGHLTPPNYACTSDVKGLGCLSVPRLAHYRLRLEDAPITIDVPDSAIGPPLAHPPP
jgi:hypothetical protein